MEILLKKPKGKTVYAVLGQSWAGRITKRDGKSITCGHWHKSRDTALPCIRRMKKNRPGNCQVYDVAEIIMVKVRRKRK